MESTRNRSWGGGNLKTFFRIGLVGLVLLYLAGAFLPFGVDAVMGIPAVIVLAAGFPFMARSFKIASCLFLGLGSALLAWGGRPAAEWLGGASSMSNIVVLVAVMQIFYIPIRLGGYDEALWTWSERRFTTRNSFFAFITVVTNILASFLNIGSVPILVSLFEDALRRRMGNYKRYFSVAVSRAYFLMSLWSPGSVNLYLVVQSSGVRWSAVFFPGLLLALLGMVFSYFIELGKGGLLGPGSAEEASPRTARSGGKEAAEESGKPVGNEGAQAGAAKIFHIPLVALAFVLSIFLMELSGFASSGQRIIIAGALIATVWTLALSRRPGLAPLLESYWKDGMMKAAEVGPFFVAIGVFSQGLQRSGILDYLGPTIRTAMGALGPVSVVLVAALIVALSIVGLHPFITIVLFGTLLSEVGLSVPPLTIALALSVGGAAAYMISPFAGVIMTIARLLDVKPSDLAIRWNWRYSLSFMTLGLIFSFAWGKLFG